MKATLGVSLAGLIALGSGLAASPSAAGEGRTSSSHPEEQIVYTASTEGKVGYGVYIIDPEGAQGQKLSPDGEDYEYNLFPLKSPDGLKVAYRGAPYATRLWVMNRDGTGRQRLTDEREQGVYGSPLSFDWSPGGGALVYAYGGEDIRSEDESHIRSSIHVVSSDGTRRWRITSQKWAALGPRWSPDGSRIIYSSDESGTTEIYSRRPDGSGKKRLTTGGGCCVDWSGDGRRILFRRGGEVWVMKRNGKAPRHVADGFDATFAPSGGAIAFVRFDVTSRRYRVWVQQPGRPAIPVTPATTDVLRYAWAPTSDRIVYDAWAGPAEDSALFVTPVDAPVPTQITFGAGDEFYADW